jgi:hypothetical protein
VTGAENYPPNKATLNHERLWSRNDPLIRADTLHQNRFRHAYAFDWTPERGSGGREARQRRRDPQRHIDHTASTGRIRTAIEMDAGGSK